jgi:hypothetical protein
MPELDYAVLCDHVRVEGGVAHVIAAGIDSTYVARVPAALNVGILVRLGFTRSECDRPHAAEVVFLSEDGERLAHISAPMTPQWDEGLPPGWRAKAQLGLNVGIALPRYGNYTFDILVNDSSVKSIEYRVLPLPGEPP